MKLTEEQQQQVTDNHNLIYAYAHKANLDLDEYYGELAVLLCEAVYRHEPDRGNLSTLYYFMCRNRMWRKHRDSKRLKRGGGVFDYSLNWEIDCGDGTYIDIQDTIEDENVNVEDEIWEKDIMEKMLAHEDGHIVELRSRGYSQGEIAEITNQSQANVSRKLIRLRKEFFGDY